MTTERIELEGPHGPIEYPSYVKSVAEPRAGAYLHEIIDCWCPERTGHLDYAQGQWHFKEAQSIAAAHNASGFIFNVLVAMMSHGCVGNIEAGFIDALASRAAVGCRPAPIEFNEHEAMDEKLRALEASIWNLIRSGPRDIAAVVSDAIKSGGPSGVVCLFVIAAAAFNGALN